MAKLGFILPDGLERRLRKYVPWGKKQQVIIGLLIILVEDLEREDDKLLQRALEKYWERKNEPLA